MSDDNTHDGAEPSLASVGSHNTDMATARLSAANAWLQDEIKRLRITDEERTAIEVAAGDYLYHQDPGGRAQHIRQTLLGLLERTK
jgi:hypothetical protein